MGTQVKSATEAARMLFEEALPQVPIAELSFIEGEYEYYVGSWKSRELIKGDKESLFKRVLTNFERTAQTPGFQFFVVDVKPAYKVAQVVVFSDGDGASVCLFRTADSLYLCGNYYFQ